MLLESVFELVSSEDQAKMEAAKMQADLAQSQQQKQHPSATDAASASGTNSQDSTSTHGASAASQASTTCSQTVNLSHHSLVTDAVATVTPVSHQPSLSSPGFMPFAKNPAKQKRYEAYLASQKAGTPCEYCLCSAAAFLLCPSICT